ncbi:hypothetical protein GIB67_027476 [Kingdonia uniflora]|uniref:Uncharacterized protein n=1 Tax=Kingdonia uniflora TaxID=39325 RepID=A0A7J7MFA9_9MAGN|nr:hypothetical protein GIB67_027476 [Kingdonia uniflora]
MLEGNLSSFLSKVKAVQYLDLSRNSLSGEIPKKLEIFASLQSLNLSFNNLQGEVPKDGVFGNVSSFSVSGNKKLCGGISELVLPKCFSQESMKTRGKFFF